MAVVLPHRQLDGLCARKVHESGKERSRSETLVSLKNTQTNQLHTTPATIYSANRHSSAEVPKAKVINYWN
ncbi:MAG: hypothetical protein LUD38_13535 [Parabacteroides sp.]|nr:hypothetical protein [Parabacteroides sp.]